MIIKFELVVEIDEETKKTFTSELSMRNYLSDRIFQQIARMIEFRRVGVCAIGKGERLPDKQSSG